METEILSEAMKEMIRQCVQEFLSDQKESMKKEEELASGVAVLCDADEAIGTFTFVGRDVGVTAFHAVYVEEEGTIHEESLNLKIADATNIKLKHVVSYPYYDIAIYKLKNATAPKYFDIHFESIAAGDEVLLISYAALGEADVDLNLPVFSHGKISQFNSSKLNCRLLADYESFPSCSGGAVLSERGKLIGIHLSSNFHQATTYPNPSKGTSFTYDCGAVRSLKWEPPAAASVNLEEPSDDSSSESDSANSSNSEVDISVVLDAFACSLRDVRRAALFAADNTTHKGHLASFLPASLIKPLLAAEPIINNYVKLKRRQRSPIAASRWEKRLESICKRFRKNR